MNRDQISQIVRQVLKDNRENILPEFVHSSAGIPRSQEAVSSPRTSRAAVLTGKGQSI